MAPLVMLWTDIRILLVDTTRVWWKLLPKILAIYMLGWLGYQLFRNGILGDRSILGQLRLNGEDVTWQRYLLVAAIVLGAYILRRVVDELHERTGWRPMGIAVSFIEAFFVLVTLMAGGDIIAKIRFWIADRQIFGWLDTLRDNISYFLSQLSIDFPAFLEVVGSFFTETAWPVFSSGLAEPIFWLAIASLVYGSSVISVAELWRKGRPLASRVRVAQRLMERNAVRSVPRSERSTRVMTEFREAFLGDLDDKYMPTLHSLRLILRAGLIFLGAYVLVYAFQTILAQLFELAIGIAIGGHPIEFWVVWGPLHGLAVQLLFEPWRLCLLAAALQRCLAIFRMRAEDSGTLHPAAGAPLTSQQAAKALIATREPERAGV